MLCAVCFFFLFTLCISACSQDREFCPDLYLDGDPDEYIILSAGALTGSWYQMEKADSGFRMVP